MQSQNGAASTGNPPNPAPAQQLRKPLQQLFLAGARVHDLLSLLQPSSWKITDAERTSLVTQVQAAESQLQTLEKWRYQFLYHLQDEEAGQKTLATLRGLIPQIKEISRALGEYEGASAEKQFQPPLDDLLKLHRELTDGLAAAFPTQFAKQAAGGPAAPVPAAAAPSAPPHAAAASSAAPAEGQKSEAPSATVASAAPPAPSASNAQAPVPTPAAAPVANPPQSAPPAATPSAVPSAVPSAAANLQPAQIQKILNGVFLSSARINDLLGLIQPQNWKLTNAERALFNERLQTAENGLKTLEKWRYQLYYHPGEIKLAQETASAISAVVPEIRGIASEAAQHQNPSTARQFNPPLQQLEQAQTTIQGYVAYKNAEVQKELAAQPAGMPGGKKLETERIQASSASAPPLGTIVTVTPPLTHDQVKAILYKVYVSEFRIRDLLSQERPNQWKASAADRTLIGQSRTAILSQLSQLEKWRGLFSAHPDNMYYAFRTYLSITDLLHPLRVFSRQASQYESNGVGDDYRRRANDLQAHLNAMVPYVGFILKDKADTAAMFQADLANCQNELGYAMHRSIHSATPIKNVVPEFQGRRARERARKAGKKVP
ncbi:MAG TPA: hypothetical protein VFZ08_13235 [Terriglobia bacterium]|nr:hypothetical protein [Terriglobia bacterium]